MSEKESVISDRIIGAIRPDIILFFSAKVRKYQIRILMKLLRI